MSILPQISGRDVVAALAKLGYEFDRQRGSHIYSGIRVRRFAASWFQIIEKVAKGTLRAIIRETGLTVEEFISLI